MSFSVGRGKSKSKNQSKPLTPDEVAGYYHKINDLSGGQLNDFAKNGTEAVDYQQLTPEELRAVGGMGATRRMDAERARSYAAEELNADPSMDVAQRFRASQLYNDDYASRLDAIAKETEAATTVLAGQERGRAYEAQLKNAKLSREDLETLANIYFGGRGQSSVGTSSSRNFSVGGSVSS